MSPIPRIKKKENATETNEKVASMNTYREKTKTMIKRGKNDTQIDEMKRTKWKSVTTAEQRTTVAGTKFRKLPPTHRKLIWSFKT